MTALDAETGAIRWRFRSLTPMVAGVTPTAGELVFTGDLYGDVLALDAVTGAVRWRWSTGLPIGGGVVTYRVDGRQYVAVAAGMHAPLTWRSPFCAGERWRRYALRAPQCPPLMRGVATIDGGSGVH
ncbi:MAG: PQQ-binding-like beta-propeller repeat protein [Gemmatimonadales bacterium]|nr:PQQ-binding-like beta-propeller repeat protein [Gemmatimonadales bacterium]